MHTQTRPNRNAVCLRLCEWDMKSCPDKSKIPAFFFFLFKSINSLSFLFPVFKLSGFFEKGENVAYTFQNKAPCIHTVLHTVAARGQTCSEVSDVPSLRSLTCSPETVVLQIKLLLLCVCVCGRKGWTPFHTSGGGSETVTSSAWHFHMSRGWGCERFLCQSVFSHTEVHFSVLTFSLLSPVSLMQDAELDYLYNAT